MSAFRISDGKCHFKQRYVQTERFVREREAQRALLGKIKQYAHSLRLYDHCRSSLLRVSNRQISQQAHGELSCFDYEALGDGTPDVCYYTFDASGKLTETVWLVSPVVAMIHDFAVTENRVREDELMVVQSC